LLDGQLAEDARLLRQVGNSAARALIERQRRDVLAAEHDAALVRLEQSHQHVEGGGLARAVGTEKPTTSPGLTTTLTSSTTARPP